MGCTGRAHYYHLPPCLYTHQHQHIKQTQLLVNTQLHFALRVQAIYHMLIVALLQGLDLWLQRECDYQTAGAFAI